MPLNRDLDGLVAVRIAESISVKQALLGDGEAIRLIADVAGDLALAFRRGRRLFLFGNGGSAADAQHIAAELVGRFQFDRPPLAAMALTVNGSVLTAIANDDCYEAVFERQISALGSAGDFAIGISTSGNSPNVLRAIDCANRRELMTFGMTGRNGGALAPRAQRCLCVPSSETPRIQEAHILVGHILCEIVEQELFGQRLVHRVLEARPEPAPRLSPP